MRGWVSAWILLIASTALAQGTGTLTVDSSRIDGRWVPVAGTSPLDLPADTTGWTVFNVTDYGADVTDSVHNDRPDIASAIAASTNNSIIYLPAGVYNIRDNTRLQISSSNRVIRCESPTNTTILSHNTDPNGSTVYFEGGGIGSWVNWTAGYNDGDTQLTIADTTGFSIGDWITTETDDTTATCALIENEQNDAGADGYFHHIAKITNVTATTPPAGVLTIDRPLKMTYSCSNPRVAEITMISHVGFENCKMEYEDPLNGCTDLGAGSIPVWEGDPAPPSFAGCTGDFNPPVWFAYVINGWVTGNIFNDWANVAVRMKWAARNLISGNKFTNVGILTTSIQNVDMNAGAVDNVIENNVMNETVVGVETQKGSENNVIAYNYFYSPTRAIRCWFNHGTYTRSTLFEGNDCDTQAMVADDFWGENGPWSSSYRSRFRRTNRAESIQFANLSIEDQYVYPPVANKWSMIANFGRWIIGVPGCASEDVCPDVDENTTNGWLEKNIMSGGYQVSTTAPGTGVDCGNGSGPTGCTPSGSFVGDNYIGDEKPVEWAADTIPTSLYRLTGPPSWWCQEACSWSQTGIGAFGDDWDLTLCKLPAQIAYEDGTCTPLGSAVGVSIVGGRLQ